MIKMRLAQELWFNICLIAITYLFILVSGQNVSCQLPVDVGTCNNNIAKRWFFDGLSNDCKLFNYSYCPNLQNDNNFATKLIYLIACIVRPAYCELDMDDVIAIKITLTVIIKASLCVIWSYIIAFYTLKQGGVNRLFDNVTTIKLKMHVKCSYMEIVKAIQTIFPAKKLLTSLVF